MYAVMRMVAMPLSGFAEHDYRKIQTFVDHCDTDDVPRCCSHHVIGVVVARRRSVGSTVVLKLMAPKPEPPVQNPEPQNPSPFTPWLKA